MEEESAHQISEGVQALITIQHAVALGATVMNNKRVLQGTMKVKVFGAKGEFREVRLLIDSGSNVSYIREDLVQEQKLQHSGKRVFRTEVFGGGSEICTRRQYQVKIEGLPRGVRSEIVQLPLYSAPLICEGLGPIPVSPWIKKLLKLNVVLTDIHAESNKIDVLIGANLLYPCPIGRKGMAVAKYDHKSLATSTISF